MPRISVIVPIHDVEAYLPACLRSLAAQTARDLEVVMVDDGSTDASAAIAERFTQRDRRFRLIRQANAGLGHARNTGAAASDGELLAFVDSDDVVPHDAYELLTAALDETGSDFASGNVQRLRGAAVTQAPFLARTFARTRLRTHVSRFQPLLADRIACNKLWRRSFWEANELRFPHGVLHEDIPVTLPAHVMAGSVDVLAQTVYRYRIREAGSGAPSITQRRLELRVLRDRLSAVEAVRAYLADAGPRKVRRWYDQRIVGDDLRIHLDLLADADAPYRAWFMARANELLDEIGPGPVRRLAAIDRLKWHLVRHHRLDELIEVLRFQHERRATTPPVRRWGRWYGDYPFRGDRELAVPRSTYRLGKRDAELGLRATVEHLRREDDRLVVEGHAHIAGLEVAAPGAQAVRLLALRPGRFTRVRLRTAAVRVAAEPRSRPDLASDGADRTWSGFRAELPVTALHERGRPLRPGTWQLYVGVRAGGLRRRLVRFTVDEPAAVDLPAASPLAVRARALSTGRIELAVRDRWAMAHDARIADGDVIELSGALRLSAATAKPRLEVRGLADGTRIELPVTLARDGDGSAFFARVPLSELVAAAADGAWLLSLMDGARRVPVGLAAAPDLAPWHAAGRELQLTRTPDGDAAIVVHDVRPVVTAARWAPGDALEIDVRLPAEATARELVLVDWHRGHETAFALVPGADAGAFSARVPARAAIAVATGPSPRRGAWQLYGRPRGDAARSAMARVRLTAGVLDALPLTAVVDERPFTLSTAPGGGALLSVPPRSAAPAPSRGASAPAAAADSAEAFAG